MSTLEGVQDQATSQLIDHLMQSDCESIEVQKKQTGDMKIQRMSPLTKLNLLGLIRLSEIICDLKMNGDVQKAIIETQLAINEILAYSQELQKEAQDAISLFGIASQNIMENFLVEL